MTGNRLVLILGDQLGPGIAALEAADPARDRVPMAEVEDEARYAWHHRIKAVRASAGHFLAKLDTPG